MGHGLLAYETIPTILRLRHHFDRLCSTDEETESTRVGTVGVARPPTANFKSPPTASFKSKEHHPNLGNPVFS